MDKTLLEKCDLDRTISPAQPREEPAAHFVLLGFLQSVLQSRRRELHGTAAVMVPEFYCCIGVF